MPEKLEKGKVTHLPYVPPLPEGLMPWTFALLPEQYFQGKRNRSPERDLMIEVLIDAVNCVTGRKKVGREVRNAARTWFKSKAEAPYTFQGICDVIDLDATQIRKLLSQYL